MLTIAANSWPGDNGPCPTSGVGSYETKQANRKQDPTTTSPRKDSVLLRIPNVNQQRSKILTFCL